MLMAQGRGIGVAIWSSETEWQAVVELEELGHISQYAGVICRDVKIWTLANQNRS